MKALARDHQQNQEEHADPRTRAGGRCLDATANLAAHLLGVLEHIDHHRYHHHGGNRREQSLPDGQHRHFR
jgi:hypothetical protein